jgi:hypothetical protein
MILLFCFVERKYCISVVFFSVFCKKEIEGGGNYIKLLLQNE